MDFIIFEDAIMIDKEVMIRMTAMAEAKAQFCVTLMWVYIITEINLFPHLLALQHPGFAQNF